LSVFEPDITSHPLEMILRYSRPPTDHTNILATGIGSHGGAIGIIVLNFLLTEDKEPILKQSTYSYCCSVGRLFYQAANLMNPKLTVLVKPAQGFYFCA
jgi:prolipoprotein diacylglyceryltransferase